REPVSRNDPIRAPLRARDSATAPSSWGNDGGNAVVAASRESFPARVANTTAASRTVRVIGPAVSKLGAIGIMPARLTKPTVGFKPTTPQTEAGETIEPVVSVPIANTQRFAATAAAAPEL